MEPYTVWSLAKAVGEVIDYDIEEESNRDVSTRYHLTGIVVHSGQASSGHYYSYILCRPSKDESGSPKWYKFDDRDVSECKMDDDEEMKNQCFGGEYMGRVRWWNACILFYTKEDVDISDRTNSLSLNDLASLIPAPIERSVRKQNIKFQHTHN
jgi:ubiquitin carboxyl-terminal hydrolase 9/24